MKNILLACFTTALLAFANFAGAAVDLNSAPAAELEAVKGIGPAKAQAIISHREKVGPFKSVDDLKGVKGFGAKTIEKLRTELTVGGSAPTPAATPSAAPAAPAAAPSAAPVAPVKK